VFLSFPNRLLSADQTMVGGDGSSGSEIMSAVIRHHIAFPEPMLESIFITQSDFTVSSFAYFLRILWHHNF